MSILGDNISIITNNGIDNVFIAKKTNIENNIVEFNSLQDNVTITTNNGIDNLEIIPPEEEQQ